MATTTPAADILRHLFPEMAIHSGNAAGKRRPVMRIQAFNGKRRRHQFARR
jgi:hypothetical protein